MLRERFGGETRNLYPFSRPRERFPRFLYGLEHSPSLRKAAERADMLHIFHAEPYPFPVLSFLNRPVIYSVIGGLGEWRRPLSLWAIRRVRAFVVTTERDRSILLSRGFDQVKVIRPGIDTSRFRWRETRP
jgi:glycosyltransferase involved in cell wall biosynthesis